MFGVTGGVGGGCFSWSGELGGWGWGVCLRDLVAAALQSGLDEADEREGAGEGTICCWLW
jgi:hypothetical protein